MQFCGGVTRSEEEGGTEGALHMQQATMEEAQGKAIGHWHSWARFGADGDDGRQARPGQASPESRTL